MIAIACAAQVYQKCVVPRAAHRAACESTGHGHPLKSLMNLLKRRSSARVLWTRSYSLSFRNLTRVSLGAAEINSLWRKQLCDGIILWLFFVPERRGGDINKPKGML